MCLSGSVATICRVGSTLKQAISVGGVWENVTKWIQWAIVVVATIQGNNNQQEDTRRDKNLQEDATGDQNMNEDAKGVWENVRVHWTIAAVATIWKDASGNQNRQNARGNQNRQDNARVDMV